MLTPKNKPVMPVCVDAMAPAPQGAFADPFTQLTNTVSDLVKPVSSALFKMDEAGNLAVALGNRAVRFDGTTAVDVTGTVIAVPANGLIAIPAKKLVAGDIIVSGDTPYQVIADDGKIIEAYNFAEGKVERLNPPVLAIAPELRNCQKVCFVYKEIFGEGLEGVIMSSLMSGQQIDFNALLQGRIVKGIGAGGGDFSKFAVLSALGQQGGNIQSMLPMLALLGGDKADFKKFAMIGMLGQRGQGGAPVAMNNLLPLLFLSKGEESEGSLLPLFLIMGMAGGQAGATNPLQSLMPLLLLGKDKLGGGKLGDIFSNPLLLMAMAGGQGGANNPMLPLLLLGKDGGIFGDKEAAAPAPAATPAE